MVLPPWLITKTQIGKKAVMSAISQNIYNDSINYDDLAAFCNISGDSNIDSQIKDLQQKYMDHLSTDQQQKEIKKPDKPQKKETRGRKNRGLTELHAKEKNKFCVDIRNTPQQLTFDNIEHLNGEVINNDDINQFAELYFLTCQSVLDQFISNNPELKPQQNYIWYKRLLIELKKHCPLVTYKELDKLYIVWDCLTWLMDTIGLYITKETFLLFTKTYDYQYRKMEEVNPAYIEFTQKINNARDNALLNELQYNPYTQTNKMFVAKVHGIIEKTEPKQIEVHHDIRDFSSLPMFKEEK